MLMRWFPSTSMARLAAALLMTGAGAPVVMAADEVLEAPVFEMKQEMPNTGTRIPHRQVWGSEVPINRRYDQLTPEQQAIVRSRYEAMAPGDEPPYPADGLVPMYKAVRTIQDRLAESGELVLFVDIDSKGIAQSISVIKSPDTKLTNAIAQVLMLTKYKPAVCGGSPCRMSYPFRMTFKVTY